MATSFLVDEGPRANFKFLHDLVELATRERVQFIDLTELVRQRVRRSGIIDGMVNIHTKHTTTAILINENEPRLLQDFRERLESWAPTEASYRHNDLEARRWQTMAPDERPNGEAHCRALLLGASETLNVAAGKVVLGRWQRIFLAELDGPRSREISLIVMGVANGASVL